MARERLFDLWSAYARSSITVTGGHREHCCEAVESRLAPTCQELVLVFVNDVHAVLKDSS